MGTTARVRGVIARQRGLYELRVQHSDRGLRAPLGDGLWLADRRCRPGRVVEPGPAHGVAAARDGGLRVFRDVLERQDAVARQVWHDAGEALADGLGIVSLRVGPALVVIGGGLSRAGEGLLDPLRVALRQRTRRPSHRRDRVGPRRPGWRDRCRAPGSRRMGP